MAEVREIEVPLEGGESIQVRLEGDEVVVVKPGRWEQRLSREQAWELAEAIDEISTAPAE